MANITEDLERAGRGDLIAFARVYDATSCSTFQLVTWTVRDSATVDQVMCAGYAEVWRMAGRYDRCSVSAGAWVVSVLHHHAKRAVADRQR